MLGRSSLLIDNLINGVETVNSISDREKKKFQGRLIIYITIDDLKQCSYLKCSYLKMGSHSNMLAVSFFRRRARLRSHAHDFHDSIEKRCGKLGRYVSCM